ncbi:hypothetical protein GJAV_G00011570 [Gymnothorax javanicus]|nr:hypothetical protein GJAV_G00011570 [Gymnothorax javanicus]
MAGSPGNERPLLQLQEVDSSKAGENGGPAGLLPAMYSGTLPALSAENHDAMCISSPYTDSGHDYPALTFYSPPILGHGGAAIQESPAMHRSLSPSLFWPSHGHNGHVSPLSLHFQQPLMYRELPPAQWAEPKPHEHCLPQTSKLAGKRLGESQDEGSSGFAAKGDMHFCAVCHDYASGYHYGVWSCEGCKAFFKRSIQGHNDYICPATNQCTIDKNRRKSCQACRLRKCYEVGMMKCGMRRERCTYRGARHRRLPQIREMGRTVGGTRASRHDDGSPPQARPGQPSALTPEQLINLIVEAEPPETFLMKEMKRPFTRDTMMMSLTNLADKELVLMISWAKKIPGFVGLDLSDQVHLLECCWLEVLMLGLMWRSVDHPGKLIFSPDLELSREEGNCVEGIMEIFDMMLAATSRFRELKLRKEEYVCLKAIVLLNPNLCTTSTENHNELESRNKLLHMLDSVTDALVWAIAKRGLTFQQQSARLAHLLMLLAHIRHLSNKGMEHLSNMKKKNIVPFYDLLLEMLDANAMHRSCLSASYSQPPSWTPAPKSQSGSQPSCSREGPSPPKETGAI